MSSLRNCLKRLGIDRYESEILIGRHGRLTKEGYSGHDAAQRAIEDRIAELAADRERILGEVAARQAEQVALRAQEVGGEVLNQTPVTTITGAEFGDGQDIKALRAAARAWYRDTLRGTTVENAASGRVIRFSDGGKAFSASADPDKIRLFAALPELLKSGTILRSAPPRDRARESNIAAYHWLEGDVQIGDRSVRVGVTIREDRKGNLYYNHNPIPTKEGLRSPGDRATPGHKPGGVSSSEEALDQSMPVQPADVNLDVLSQPDGSASPRGTFSPNTNTIALLKGADLSTFLHESGHYFFENDLALAADLLAQPGLQPGEQQIVDDVAALLTWHGFTGPVQEQLEAWRVLDFEEKRAYHERTAESFEAYLFEGKAPSIELQRPFQQFRARLVSVYRSLKDLQRNPDVLAEMFDFSSGDALLRELATALPPKDRVEALTDDQSAVDRVAQQWVKAVRGFSSRRPRYIASLPTPAALRAVVASEKSIDLPARVLMQIGKDHPDVPAAVVEDLPRLLSDPRFAFAHSDGGVNVVVDATTEKGEPIFVGVRDGRIRTVTPLNDDPGRSGAQRLADRIESALGRAGSVSTRNNEALVKTRASAAAPDRTNPVEASPRSNTKVITRDAACQATRRGLLPP
jgi:hypothetical protein